MIKYNDKTIVDGKYNSEFINKMMYNGREIHKRFIADGEPTPPVPPTPVGKKFIATYSNGDIITKDCDGDTIKEHEVSLTNLTDIVIGGCTNPVYQAFYGADSLSGVTIEEGVKWLGGSSFKNSRAITDIVLPSTLTNLNASSFENCTNLSSVTFNCQAIDYFATRAFMGCNQLNVIDIPSTCYIASIGTKCFSRGNSSTQKTIIFRCLTPPTNIGSEMLQPYNARSTDGLAVYVPDETYDEWYTKLTERKVYPDPAVPSEIIHPLSEYQG